MLNELAAAVRDRRVSPEELVTEALRRIEAHDSEINSVVSLRAEAALADARNSPREGPLAGIPFLVKDLARCSGLPTTYGSALYADAPADEADDTTVARLRAAGAIPIGKSNTPAFGHTALTYNQVFGITRNPWNLECSPGGSSGGSAAALAAGLVPIATSSDGGGSVRIPASLCGLVGYKPTTGSVGRDGSPRWIDFSTWGATGRSVDDVLAEARVYYGPTQGDVISLPAGSVDPTPVLPRRALLCRTLRGAVEPIIETALRDAAGALEALGVEVEEVENPIPGALGTWVVVAAADLAQSLDPHRDRWPELEPTLQALLGFAEHLSLDDYITARRDRYRICAVLDRLLGDDAVLLTPTLNATSFPADATALPVLIGDVEDAGVFANTPEANVTGHPGVSVPIGRDEAGVPIGMQVIAPRWRDGLALGVAASIEAARPWPQQADGYDAFPVP